MINHATSSNLYWSYYPHRAREVVSPVCGIFLVQFTAVPPTTVKSRIKVDKTMLTAAINMFGNSTAQPSRF